MLYAPKRGDIGLTQIEGEVGKWIRRGQWLIGDGYYDIEHAVVFVDEDLQGRTNRIIEAEPGGALNSPLTRYKPGAVVWLRCPDEFRESVARAALGLEGVPYSFADYAAIGAHRLHVPAPGLKTFVGATGHMICSQLADEAAARGGWHLFADGRWPGYVTPSNLYTLYLEQQRSRFDSAA